MWRAVKTNPAHDITTQRQQEQVIRPETRQEVFLISIQMFAKHFFYYLNHLLSMHVFRPSQTFNRFTSQC